MNSNIKLRSNVEWESDVESDVELYVAGDTSINAHNTALREPPHLPQVSNHHLLTITKTLMAI